MHDLSDRRILLDASRELYLGAIRSMLEVGAICETLADVGRFDAELCELSMLLRAPQGQA